MFTDLLFYICGGLFVLAMLIVVIVSTVKNRKRKKALELNMSDENARLDAAIKEREERLDSYSKLIAYWLSKLEEHHSAAVLTRELKVKLPLYDEYLRLELRTIACDRIINFMRTRYIFDAISHRALFPFIGNDDIYYAISISSSADAIYDFTDENLKHYVDDIYCVSLIPYAQDKFLNSKVEPVEYDNYYLPRFAFDESVWMLEPTYEECIFYD